MAFDLATAKPSEAKGFDLASPSPAGKSLVDQIPDMPPQPQPPKEPKWWQKALGTGEAALSTGLGMVAMPVGSAIGLAKGLFGGKLGTPEGVREASELASRASRVTRPQTEAGLEKLDQFGRFIESTKIAGLAPEAMLSTAAIAPFAAPQISKGVKTAARATAKALEPEVEFAKTAGRKVGALVTPDIDATKLNLARKAQALGIEIRPDMLTNNRVAKVFAQALEEVPFSGAKDAIRQEAFNRALIAILDGDKTAKRMTPDVFSAAFNRAGKTIGDMYEKSNIPLGTDVELQNNLVAHLTNTSKETADVASIVRSYVDEVRNAAKNGVIPGTALRKINTEIGGKVRTTESGDLRHALSELQDDLNEALKRQLSGEDLAVLEDARRRYAIGTKLIPLVAKSPTGNISPGSLMQAVTSSKPAKRAMAMGAGGDVGDLAKIGQVFLKEPSTSFSAERGLAYTLLGGGTWVNPAALPYMVGGANLYNRLGPWVARKMTGYKPGAPKFKDMVESTQPPADAPPGPPAGPQSGPFGGSGLPPVVPPAPSAAPPMAPPDIGPFGTSGLQPPRPRPPAPMGAPASLPSTFRAMLDSAAPKPAELQMPAVPVEQRWDGIVRQPGVEAAASSRPVPKAYTPEVQAKLAEAKTKFDETLAFYRRNYQDDPFELQKRLKGAGMRYAAERRAITGELTAREAAAVKAREAGNYIGKEVSVDGLPAKVTSNPFGRVKVEFEDGRTMTVDANRIKPPGAPADPALMMAGLKPPKVTSLLQKIREMGGIDPSYAQDLTGESKMGAKGVPIGLFAKDTMKGGKGTGLDDLATRLKSEGWDIATDDPDGGVGSLTKMIQDELGGKKTYSFADEEKVAGYERDVRLFQEAEDAKPIASELKSAGLEAADEVDATLVARAAEIDEGAFERLSMQFADDDAGFMQGIKEIIDGANKGAKAGEGGEAGAGTQAFGLEGETEAQIRAREAAARVASEKAAQAAKAPPPQDFLLSGSSRAADEAAARGQSGFSDFLDSTRR